MSKSAVQTEAHANVFKDFQAHRDQPTTSTELAILTSLRRHYPDWSVTTTPEASTGLVAFADAGKAQGKLDPEDDQSILWRSYKPATGRAAGKSGKFEDELFFAKYDYNWDKKSFLVYLAHYVENFQVVRNYFVLYQREENDLINGQSKAVDALIAAASQYNNDLHEEVLVFDQERWTKNKELWKSVQQSTWEDVILDRDLKDVLVLDVQGFFDCKDDYKQFSVPWKRGIILHGLPGNGKTISIKALMHSLSYRPDPIPTLYVKSLAGCHGPHYAIRQIFVKARQMAPCLLVFEDLDSLITDQVKSFFLNEVDGLESNDGIMMIGSTNYLERLDPGISKRPSRFDRKYHFTLPAMSERIQYCDYWRSRLATNKAIDYPPELSKAIAELTQDFSFAYLKEAFITSLLIIVAVQRGTNQEFRETPAETNGDVTKENSASKLKKNLLYRVLSKQVQTLRHEMEGSRKSAEEAAKHKAPSNNGPVSPFSGAIDDEETDVFVDEADGDE